MSNLRNRDYFGAVAKGETNSSIMTAIGERTGIGTTATGEDLWRGTATSIPTPPDIGEQMTVVSSNANDTSAGSGVRTIRIEYLDASGDEQTEDITLNGTTGVNTVATDIRFVNDMYSLTVGANGVAEGNIDIHQVTKPTIVYNMIAAGGNKSLVPHRMVPNGKTLILKGWHATEAVGKRVAVRIRSTDMNGILIPGVFCFKGTAYIKQGTTGELVLNETIPSLSIVKVSAWGDEVNSEGACGWWGELITN